MRFDKGLAVFLCLGLVPGFGLEASSSARAGDNAASLQKLLPSLLGGSDSTSSFTRSGSDKLSTANLASGGGLSFTYDATYGQMTGIADTGGFSLSYTADALLHLPLSQAVTENGETLISAAITYDADGLRASRTVSAGSEGEGSSTTLYWHGGELHPLVVTRDGINYRLIGKGVVEQAADQPTRSYSHGDHLGSVRMVTDDAGTVADSLSYDGDYGLTRIQGQTYASADDSMTIFYRFQGQEQETFPLAKLGISDSALAQWLDSLQLYHFPWRDYGAGLASFTQTDPIPRDDSLYAALGANPVNYTDETGGMFQPPTSILQNFDPERERLLAVVVSDQSATINRAESEMLYDLLTRVQDEIDVFRDEIRGTGDRLLVGLRLEIDRQMLDAGVTWTSDLDAQIRVLRHPHLRGLREEWHSFNRDSQRWLGAFEAVQRRWLDTYDQPIMNSVRMNLQENEDATDDEKADVLNENDELRPMMPATGAEAIAADPDSDDDVMVGFPTQGGHAPQDGGRTIAPARPQEENDRIRPCCNIL
jgi:RHS repeat-associated protein